MSMNVLNYVVFIDNPDITACANGTTNQSCYIGRPDFICLLYYIGKLFLNCVIIHSSIGGELMSKTLQNKNTSLF